MKSSPVRGPTDADTRTIAFTLFAAALLAPAAAGCARSENAGDADALTESIARNDLDQAAATDRRRDAVADEKARRAARAAEKAADTPPRP